MYTNTLMHLTVHVNVCINAYVNKYVHSWVHCIKNFDYLKVFASSHLVWIIEVVVCCSTKRCLSVSLQECLKPPKKSDMAQKWKVEWPKTKGKRKEKEMESHYPRTVLSRLSRPRLSSSSIILTRIQKRTVWKIKLMCTYMYLDLCKQNFYLTHAYSIGFPY